MASAFTQQELQADSYRWRSDGKGTMVHIFCEAFGKKTMEDRYGRKRDVDAVYIKNFFEQNRPYFPGGADVECQIIKSLTEANKMIKAMDNDECYEKYDCFLFAFLTFLKPDGRLQFRDQDGGSLEEVLKVVSELHVARGKPKIFLVQSDDMSLSREKEKEKGHKEPHPERKVIKIPTDADRLIIQSTIPQAVAKEESFMIQAFVEVIEGNINREPAQRKDLLSLTTDINSSVKNKVTSLKPPLVREDDLPVPLVTSTQVRKDDLPVPLVTSTQVRKDDLPVPLVTSTLTKLLNLHKNE